MSLTAEIILQTFGEDLITDLTKKLQEHGVTYNGGDSRLAAKMRFRVVPTSDGSNFQLLMPDYSYFVNKGREPGNVSAKGQAGIAEWGKRKGYIGDFQTKDLIRRKAKQAKSKREHLKQLKKMPFDRAKKAFGFVVARTINKKGYKGTHFLDEIIEDGRVAILLNDLKSLLNGNNNNS